MSSNYRQLYDIAKKPSSSKGCCVLGYKQKIVYRGTDKVPYKNGGKGCQSD